MLLHALLLAALAVSNQDSSTAASGPAAEPPAEMVETSSTVTVAGESLACTVRAGTQVARDEDGTERARLFHVSYLLDGADAATRPVTFLFNGGPGSSSVWLHLGAFGPRRVLMDPEGFPLPPPGRLVDNPHSLLDVTDLVFVDPVSTGFSRAAGDRSHEEFHGYQQDLESVGAFVERWTSEHDRWASPKFLCGESYGTTRAAGLAAWLQERHGMYLNGIVLVSAVLDFRTLRFDAGNDLPHVLFLPTYAATAHHHGRLGEDLADLERTLTEVEDFALGEYATALLRGASLPEEERGRIAGRIARYTGLDVEFVLERDLRVRPSAFTKELLRDRRLTVGRLDSRYTGRDRDASGEEREYDPSYAAIQGPYSAAINDYLRRELGYRTELPYEVLTGRVQPWDWSGAENRYLDVSEALRGAMARNPHLEVYLAGGYHDLATPYLAAEYTLDHLSMEPGYRRRIATAWFPAGHMMYVQEASLARLSEGLRAWYRELAER